MPTPTPASDEPRSPGAPDPSSGVARLGGGETSTGVVCVAVDAGEGKAVGCDLGSPSGARFPSPQRPILDF